MTLLAKIFNRLYSIMHPTSLISWREAQWLTHHIANKYRGEGQIVELGPFLGASTNCLAKGLSKSEFGRGRKILTYDRFSWPLALAQIPRFKALGAKLGEDFMPLFLKKTKKYEAYIEPYRADLTEVEYHGAPIEFLFIDAMKSHRLACGIVEQFFPLLQPKSTVVQQDFLHYGTPWDKYVMYKLRKNLIPLERIKNSSSMVFTLKTEISDYLVKDPQDISTIEIAETFDYAKALLPEGASDFGLSKVLMLEQCGHRKTALNELERIRPTTKTGRKKLEDVRKRIGHSDSV